MPVRVYDIAKKLGLESKEILVKAKDMGIAAAKVPSSSLDKITAEWLEEEIIKTNPAVAARLAPKPVEEKPKPVPPVEEKIQASSPPPPAPAPEPPVEMKPAPVVKPAPVIEAKVEPVPAPYRRRTAKARGSSARAKSRGSRRSAAAQTAGRRSRWPDYAAHAPGFRSSRRT